MLIRFVLIFTTLFGQAYAQERFVCPEGSLRHVLEQPLLGMTKYFCSKEVKRNHIVVTGPMLYIKNGEKFMSCIFDDGVQLEECTYYPKKTEPNVQN